MIPPDFTLILILPNQSEHDISRAVKALEISDHWELREIVRGLVWTRELEITVRCEGTIPVEAHCFKTYLRLTLPDSPTLRLIVVDTCVDLMMERYTHAIAGRGYTLKAMAVPTP